MAHLGISSSSQGPSGDPRTALAKDGTVKVFTDDGDEYDVYMADIVALEMAQRQRRYDKLKNRGSLERRTVVLSDGAGSPKRGLQNIVASDSEAMEWAKTMRLRSRHSGTIPSFHQFLLCTTAINKVLRSRMHFNSLVKSYAKHVRTIRRVLAKYRQQRQAKFRSALDMWDAGVERERENYRDAFLVRFKRLKKRRKNAVLDRSRVGKVIEKGEARAFAKLNITDKDRLLVVKSLYKKASKRLHQDFGRWFIRYGRQNAALGDKCRELFGHLQYMPLLRCRVGIPPQPFLHFDPTYEEMVEEYVAVEEEVIAAKGKAVAHDLLQKAQADAMRRMNDDEKHSDSSSTPAPVDNGRKEGTAGKEPSPKERADALRRRQSQAQALRSEQSLGLSQTLVLTIHKNPSSWADLEQASDMERRAGQHWSAGCEREDDEVMHPERSISPSPRSTAVITPLPPCSPEHTFTGSAEKVRPGYVRHALRDFRYTVPVDADTTRSSSKFATTLPLLSKVAAVFGNAAQKPTTAPAAEEDRVEDGAVSLGRTMQLQSTVDEFDQFFARVTAVDSDPLPAQTFPRRTSHGGTRNLDEFRLTVGNYTAPHSPTRLPRVSHLGEQERGFVETGKGDGGVLLLRGLELPSTSCRQRLAQRRTRRQCIQNLGLAAKAATVSRTARIPRKPHYPAKP